MARVWFSSLILHALLGLDRLVEPLLVAPALEHPTGELVDDLHLAVLDEVVDVALVELLRLEGDVEMVDEVDVGEVVHVLDTEHLLHPGDPVLGGDHLALLLVDLVVLVADQLAGDPGEVLVVLAGVADRPRDDQRGPRLVDQDRVDLVDDGVGVAPLHPEVGPHRHVVAQIVEPELVVGPVGDVGGVGGAALCRGHLRLDQADLEPEEAVDAAHPLGVALGQVVVDGDEVDPGATEGVEVGRHRRHQRLALAGLHLGDGAVGGAPRRR